jgi:hypothetical protein
VSFQLSAVAVDTIREDIVHLSLGEEVVDDENEGLEGGELDIRRDHLRS